MSAQVMTLEQVEQIADELNDAIFEAIEAFFKAKGLEPDAMPIAHALMYELRSLIANAPADIAVELGSMIGSQVVEQIREGIEHATGRSIGVTMLSGEETFQ